MTIEFKVGNYTYRARQMDALTQADILARLSPVFAAGIGEIVPFFAELQKQAAENGIGKVDLGAVSKDRAFALLLPFAKALNEMSDKDRRFVISACLDLCERSGGGEAWAKVWNAPAGRAMFDDINNDLSVILRIMTEVLRGTFSNFFSGLASNLIGEA